MSGEVKIEQRRMQIGSTRVYYQTTGAEGGEPVVLVHGLSGSTRWWERNVGALARQFRVYVIDLIGFGATRSRERFVLREAAAYLTEWMTRLNVSRASMVGHSMGGFITADLAARHPERVNRLVLVDAAALPFGRGMTRQVAGMVHSLWYLPLGFFPILLTDAYRAGPVAVLRAAHELFTTDVRPKLSQIQTPTLVIWGEHDTVVPLKIGQELSRSLPQAESVVIKGAGHNPMWERPDEFNRLVVDFIGRP